MEFIKAHYEKVILSVVLLGLAAAAALMPMKVAQEKQKEDDRKSEIRNPRVKALEPVVLTNTLAVVARVDSKSRFDLSGEHNVFNPVRWLKQPGSGGGILKGTDAGVNALTVTNITPLYLRVTFDEVIGSGNDVKYKISVTREDKNPRPLPRLAGPGQKNELFTVREVRGDQNNPNELAVLMAGEKDPIVISKDKGHEEIIGYAADLRYEPENNRTWKNLKAKDELSFGGETYNIVAITEDEVVLSAKSNKKQTTKQYKPLQK